jgi:hypothetical protein
VELLGNGVLPTVNYERLVWAPALNSSIAIRLGGLFIPEGNPDGRFEYEMVVPFEISAIQGKRNVKFELGVGLTYYGNSDTYSLYGGDLETDKYYLVIPVLRIGGRWQPSDKPYFIRLGFTPLFFGENSPDYNLPVYPFGGISFGYSFGKKKSN